MIKVSDNLELPVESATETFAILAVRGAGKSNAAAVMAEEMFRNGMPFVAVDPVGSWWGLRADGECKGLSIPIFGGKRGDIPLERNGGSLIADLVVDKRLSCVLDLTGFDSEASKKAFLLDFAKRLYERNEEPLHLFLEEADDYIPQVPMGDEKKLLRAFENIVRRGRSRGLGLTMITQRSAAINKNVLTQAGTLIAMRTTGPQDVAAVEAWIKYHGAKQGILASLPSLECGEAWVYSPQFLKETVRTKFRKRQTYDSGATPKAGAQSRPAATLADIDMAAVKEMMASTIEAAKESDPKELKARIKQLERQLADRKPSDADEGLRTALLEAQKLLDTQACLMQEGYEIARKICNVLVEVTDYASRLAAVLNVEMPVSKVPERLMSTIAEQIEQKPVCKEPKPAPEGITGPQMKVLNALAWWKAAGFEAPTKLQIAYVAGYAPGAGAFNNICGSLRSAGLIEYPSSGAAKLTETGIESARLPDVPLSLDEFHDFVMEKLTGPQCKVLRELIHVWPHSMAKNELALKSGYTPGTGAFNNICGSLRSLGLADYPERGTVSATVALYPEGL